MVLDLRSHSAEWQTSIPIWPTQAGFKSIMFFLDKYQRVLFHNEDSSAVCPPGA